MQHQIIVGSMLGDLSVERRGPTSNSRLQFKHSIKEWFYMEHLYTIMEEFCGTAPKLIHNLDRRSGRRTHTFSIMFKTLSLPCFNIYRE